MINEKTRSYYIAKKRIKTLNKSKLFRKNYLVASNPCGYDNGTTTCNFEKANSKKVCECINTKRLFDINKHNLQEIQKYLLGLSWFKLLIKK